MTYREKYIKLKVVDFLQVLILSIVQGITEFLPVSSSAHLVIFSHFLNYEHNFTLDIFLHSGTLLAVILYFRKSIGEFFNLQIVLRILVATLPAGVMGILFKGNIENIFENINFIPYFLSLTGLILFFSRYLKLQSKSFSDITLKDALIVGMFQAVALLPGISRSGITIVGAMLLGIKREDAAKLSFYMFLLATLGATSLEGKELLSQETHSTYLTYYLIGIILSAIVGYLAIGALMKILKNRDLRIFSYYCWGLSLLLIILRW